MRRQNYNSNNSYSRQVHSSHYSLFIKISGRIKHSCFCESLQSWGCMFVDCASTMVTIPTFDNCFEPI